MGLFDKIKEKLKGKKQAQDGLEKAKATANSAIDTAAAKAGVDAGKAGAAKEAVGQQIDKVKADLA